MHIRSISINLAAIFAVVFAACEAQEESQPEIIDFGAILAPHYPEKPQASDCDKVQQVDIPVFGDEGQRISFEIGSCKIDGEWTGFEFKPEVFGLKDYVMGTLKFPTPEDAYKLNPQAGRYMEMGLPQFRLTELGSLTVEEYIRDQKSFHGFDWNICKIRTVDTYIWTLENTAYKEVPAENYLIGDYENVQEWRANHEKDKAQYRAKYSAQLVKNRACANEQGYWIVAKDGILIKFPSPAGYITDNGLNPASIVLRREGK